MTKKKPNIFKRTLSFIWFVLKVIIVTAVIGITLGIIAYLFYPFENFFSQVQNTDGTITTIRASIFSMIISGGTVLGVIVTGVYVIAQIRSMKSSQEIEDQNAQSRKELATSNTKQAIALKTQTDALLEQAEIANKNNNYKRFAGAVDIIFDEEQYTKHHFAMNEINNVARNSSKDFFIQATNIFRFYMERTSTISDELAQIKNPPIEVRRKNNILSGNLTLCLNCFPRVFSKYMSDGHTYRIEDHWIVNVVIHPIYLERLKVYNPTTIVDVSFDGIGFYQCRLQGILFKDCIFYNSEMLSIHNFSFVNCIFGANAESILSQSTNNTFNECLIWEANAKGKLVEEAIKNKNLKVIKQSQFDDWNKLHVEDKLKNWDKFKLVS